MLKDVEILRDLADRYALFARSPENKEKIRLHQAINDLEMIRPVVLIDEIPWEEMEIDDELTLRCVDPDFRALELFLRRNLYQQKYMPADKAVTDYIPVPKIIHSTGFGLDVKEEILSNGENVITSHRYHNQFEDDNLDMLQDPVITYDQAGTMYKWNKIGEAIGDILPVKIVGEATGYGLGCKTWDTIATYMGADNLLMALIERPDFMHRLVQRLTDMFLSVIRQYEQLNLIDTEALYCHCSPATTSKMPKEIGDNEHNNLKKVWGRGLAQILAAVSPAMHDEFDIQYMIKAMEPFGFVYYGCCEPLHHKIGILEQIPNLRKISITPWADIDIAADCIGKRYVLSVKPNPSLLAHDNLDENALRNELTKIISACKRNDCSFELILKDISTVRKNPQNLFAWERIAMEMVGNV